MMEKKERWKLRSEKREHSVASRMHYPVLKKIFWHTLLAANFYAILFVWYLGSGDLLKSGVWADVLIAFGRLSGLLLQFFILIELVLISRLVPLEALYGFDKTNAIHRMLGYALLGFIFLHPLLLTFGYALQSERGFIAQWSAFLFHWEDVLSASIAFFIILLVGILALPWIRRALSYEFWYFTHVPIYLAILLAWGHQTNSGDVASGASLYYWLTLTFLVFGALVFYRFLIPLYKNWYHAFRVVRVVRESKDVVSVYLTGKHMERFHFDAGQFARLIFFQKGMWQGHPFSFSAPYNGKELRFSIKGLGDWTEKADTLRVGTRVWLEGPLGGFTLNKRETDKLLFIAGGIGVTPLLAMARSLARGTDARFLYSARTADSLVFWKELQETHIPLHALLSEETKPEFLHGKLTTERIASLCPDFEERDIYLCGPPRMMNALARELPHAGVSPARLHFEKFSF